MRNPPHKKMDALSRQAELKQKIRTQRPVLGVFVKIPALHIVEVLANADLDFIVLDAEHGPFNTQSLDQCVLAARANNLPAFVRVADSSAREILRALDIGAAGIFVPHIKSANAALAAIAATRYTLGNRGFSASHRAGDYGAVEPRQYIKASDQSTIVIGQIEDVEAVDNIDEIAAVSDLDALFIGPADLTVSYKVADWDDPVIEHAIDKVCHSARQAGRTVGIYQPGVKKVAAYREKGVSLFTISTDQALLLTAARTISEEFNKGCG